MAELNIVDANMLEGVRCRQPSMSLRSQAITAGALTEHCDLCNADCGLLMLQLRDRLLSAEFEEIVNGPRDLSHL